MKTVLAGLACSAWLLAGAAGAQTGQTANDNSSAQGSAANPTPPSSHTTPAAAATTARSGEASRHPAAADKCRKAADDKKLSGSARTDYLRSCPNKVAPR